MNVRQFLEVSDLGDGAALLESIPSRAEQLVALYGDAAKLDGSVESLDRLREVLVAAREDGEFSSSEAEVVQMAFGYLCTVCKEHLGREASIDRKHWEANHGHTWPVLPGEESERPMPLAGVTSGLFYRRETSPSEILRARMDNTTRKSPPAPPPWLRSRQYAGTLFVESPISLSDLDISGQTVGNATEGSFADWRYRIALNTTPDPELIADMTVHPDLQGTMPDTVSAVWELTAEADPDMNHFNDWVHLIQTIENAHTNAAFINNH